MISSDDKGPIPVLDTKNFVEWIEKGGSPLVEIGNYQLIQVNNLQALFPVIADAYNKGFVWMLMDGPRKQRPRWLLDPWWKEEPEMSAHLQQITQAHSINLVKLFEELSQRFNRPQDEFNF